MCFPFGICISIRKRSADGARMGDRKSFSNWKTVVVRELSRSIAQWTPRNLPAPHIAIYSESNSVEKNYCVKLNSHLANFHISRSCSVWFSALEVYWNIPTFMCKKHNIDFSHSVPTYGIRQNKNDSFQWVSDGFFLLPFASLLTVSPFNLAIAILRV